MSEDSAGAKAVADSNGSRFLSKEQIRAAKDYREEIVPVPEWGGDVVVKGLTGDERDAFERSITERRRDGGLQPSIKQVRAKFVTLVCLDAPSDEGGKRLFGKTDIEWIGSKSAVALQRIFEVGTKLSGMSKEDIEELELDLGDDPNE